jgi:hypothetical protein
MSDCSWRNTNTGSNYPGRCGFNTRHRLLNARADIRYQDRKGLRFFPLRGPRSKFKSKESAEQNVLKEAKKQIDRLIKA